jgi:hypothetical protein
MNYKNLLEEIRYLSVNHNLVESFVEGDNVYEINSTDNVYPVVYLTSKPHQLGHPTSIFNFYIYYVDRLTHSRDNRLDIQSAGIRVINDTVLGIIDLENTDVTYPITLTSFTEKFSDECSGVYAEVSIETFNDQTECTRMNYSVGIITEEEEQIISEESEPLVIEGGTLSPTIPSLSQYIDSMYFDEDIVE